MSRVASCIVEERATEYQLANVASGKLVFGGPLFDDAERPIGSFLLAECADRAELDAMIADDPYRKANVWQRVDVKPARLVVQNGKITP